MPPDSKHLENAYNPANFPGAAIIEHFADRLLAAIRAKGSPICVGLDPVIERLPEAVTGGDHVERIESWCLAVIEAVAEHVPAVKPQLACFERYGADGYAVYQRVVSAAKAKGLIVIADAKRGDIGISASHYAAGLLSGPQAADALTVNAYLGADSLQPFADTAEQAGAGLFALVRTSNPGSDAMQGLPLQDGRTVSQAIAQIVADLGSSKPGYLGKSGYSLLGAVVGATKPADAAALRGLMPQQIFLVPGFGAQGGGLDDVKACFKPDGTGAIITASRSVIYAHEKAPGVDWKSAVAQAAAEFSRQIKSILG
jgi:orotidine-5'-phosphate decarboxylase